MLGHMVAHAPNEAKPAKWVQTVNAGYVAVRIIQQISVEQFDNEPALIWIEFGDIQQEATVIVDGKSHWPTREEATAALAILLQRLGGVA